MTHKPALPHARSDKRATWNYQQVMEELGCSKRHVYNLFDRGELLGFYIGDGRGLRIYVDSVQALKECKNEL